MRSLCIFVFSDGCFECKQRVRLRNCRAISGNLGGGWDGRGGGGGGSPCDGWLEVLTKKDLGAGASVRND